MSIMYVKQAVFLFMNGNIHMVANVSKILALNSKTQFLEELLIVRDNFKNVLDYCNFENRCVFISKFIDLIYNMLN